MKIDKFEVGKRYGVWLWDDSDPIVTVVSRTKTTITLNDGTTHKICYGSAPTKPGETDTSDLSEVIRLPAEIGKGVVRTCHEVITEREQGDLFAAA